MASFTLRSSIHLWHTLVAQDLRSRYRGTLLGWLWPLLNPLVLLLAYGFVFGAVFQARWPGQADDDHLPFALYLLCGLLVHGLLAETVSGAPGLLPRHANYVRKVVFPLPLLPAIPMGVGLVHSGIGLLLLVGVAAATGLGPHVSALATPFILAPLLVFVWGLGLLFAALGVYVRDLQQVSGVFVMLTLLVGPVFFPADRVPEGWGWLLQLNPIAWPVESVRQALLQGIWPSPLGWLGYSAAAVSMAGIGWMVFAKLRRGFADVL